MVNSLDTDQTTPIGAVCSGSVLFDSILNLSVMLGNYLQQTTSADDIFRCIFSWRFKGQNQSVTTLNDTPNSLQSPRVEMTMRCVCHLIAYHFLAYHFRLKQLLKYHFQMASCIT